MFINSQKLIVAANRLAARNISYQSDYSKKSLEVRSAAKLLHTSTQRPNYAAADVLPIPQNIDAAETTRFSPQRTRDISGDVMLSTNTHIDITADSSMNAAPSGAASAVGGIGYDPHVQSYDCFGAVSLNSAMQSNVPSPFGGMHKFSHLNMPGGQWSQESKFTSQNMQNSHYRALRESARAAWVAYDQNATIDRKESNRSLMQPRRAYSTKTTAAPRPQEAAQRPSSEIPPEQQELPPPKPAPTPPPLTKKEQLKRAFKDYGATVIVFHVGISLLSLGGCYLLVSGGIDLVPALEFLGLASSTLTQKIATGASTFVVAYAIHKVFAPVRISITLGATPFIVRYLRSKGLLKAKIAPK